MHTVKDGPTDPALQHHVSFFDRRNCGVFYPSDTYAGFRALGFNILLSLVSALAFHLLHVSYPTQESWIPDLRFPVVVRRIGRAKHGRDKKGGLTFREIFDMWAGNRNVLDPIGWVFQVFLWTYLYLLAADPQTGVLEKETVRQQYDGTLYYELEKRQKSGNKLPFWRGGELW